MGLAFVNNKRISLQHTPLYEWYITNLGKLKNMFLNPKYAYNNSQK